MPKTVFDEKEERQEKQDDFDFSAENEQEEFSVHLIERGVKVSDIADELLAMNKNYDGSATFSEVLYRSMGFETAYGIVLNPDLKDLSGLYMLYDALITACENYNEAHKSFRWTKKGRVRKAKIKQMHQIALAERQLVAENEHLALGGGMTLEQFLVMASMSEEDVNLYSNPLDSEPVNLKAELMSPDELRELFDKPSENGNAGSAQRKDAIIATLEDYHFARNDADGAKMKISVARLIVLCSAEKALLNGDASPAKTAVLTMRQQSLDRYAALQGIHEEFNAIEHEREQLSEENIKKTNPLATKETSILAIKAFDKIRMLEPSLEYFTEMLKEWQLNPDNKGMNIDRRLMFNMVHGYNTNEYGLAATEEDKKWRERDMKLVDDWLSNDNERRKPWIQEVIDKFMNYQFKEDVFDNAVKTMEHYTELMDISKLIVIVSNLEKDFKDFFKDKPEVTAKLNELEVLSSYFSQVMSYFSLQYGVNSETVEKHKILKDDKDLDEVLATYKNLYTTMAPNYKTLLKK
jgi:hypothetical protein